MTDESSSTDCLGIILGDDLREFARSNSDVRRSVLLEIKLADPLIEFHNSPRQQHGEPIRPKGVLVENDEQRSERLEVVERAKKSISSIVGGLPNWLPSAHTFVVRVNSTELCALSKIADVSKIIANSEVKN